MKHRWPMERLQILVGIQESSSHIHILGVIIIVLSLC